MKQIWTARCLAHKCTWGAESEDIEQVIKLALVHRQLTGVMHHYELHDHQEKSKATPAPARTRNVPARR